MNLRLKNYNYILPGIFTASIILLIITICLYGFRKYYNLDLFINIIDDSYVQRLVIFTIFQAGLSTIVSILIAIPFALTISKYLKYTFTRAILSLAWLAFVSPVIIGVFAIINIHGASGWISNISLFFGGERLKYLYGLNGIIIAHIFFNAPFAMRNILISLNNTPKELLKVSSQYNFSKWDMFRVIQWPAIRANLFPTAAIIFSLCFTSFIVVLILGGGPKYSILEVAIYYSLKIEFDIDRAVSLGILQIFTASLLVLIIVSFSKKIIIEPYTKIKFQIISEISAKNILLDILVLIIAILIFFIPIIGLLISAITSITLSNILNPDLGISLFWSLVLGMSSGLLSLFFSIMLLITIRELAIAYRVKWVGKLLELSGNIILILPPVLLGTGLFLSLRNYFNVQEIAPIIIVTINCLTTIPFVLRILGPEYLRISELHHKLFISYNIYGLVRFHKYEYPHIKQAMGIALAVSVTLSIGDLGVISLFGSTEIKTLPLYIYQCLGSYRMNDAAAGIAVLLSITLIIIYGIEYLFRNIDD